MRVRVQALLLVCRHDAAASRLDVGNQALGIEQRTREEAGYAWKPRSRVKYTGGLCLYASVKYTGGLRLYEADYASAHGSLVQNVTCTTVYNTESLTKKLSKERPTHPSDQA